MISIGVSPFSRVFLNSQAMSSATTMPSKYMESIVKPGSLRKPSTVRLGMHAAMSNV